MIFGSQKKLNKAASQNRVPKPNKHNYLNKIEVMFQVQQRIKFQSGLLIKSDYKASITYQEMYKAQVQ